MGFFKVNTEEASKVEGGGSNYVTQSGIYDIVLKALIVDVNDKGARTLNPYFSVNDQDQVIYGGIRLDNNDGSANFQANVFNKLCVVCGLEDIEDPVEATLPIGKGGIDKDVAVLPDFEEIPLKMRVQMEYSVYNGQIQEKKVIKTFYREDGAEASEILNESEVGVKLEKDQAYASNVTYKDDLTAEVVAEWIANGRTGGATGTPAKAAPKAQFGRKFGAAKKD